MDRERERERRRESENETWQIYSHFMLPAVGIHSQWERVQDRATAQKSYRHMYRDGCSQVLIYFSFLIWQLLLPLVVIICREPQMMILKDDMEQSAVPIYYVVFNNYHYTQ